MYLHIGNDLILNYNDVIAIFNIEALEKHKKIEAIIKDLEVEEKNIIDISENNKKTMILVNMNDENKIYISNITAGTLEKRARNNKI